MIGSQTLRPPVTPPELRWVARSDDEPRCAFRRVDGAGGLRSLCGRLWTAAWNSGGNGACVDCQAVLGQVLAGRVTL